MKGMRGGIIYNLCRQNKSRVEEQDPFPPFFPGMPLFPAFPGASHADPQPMGSVPGYQE